MLIWIFLGILLGLIVLIALSCNDGEAAVAGPVEPSTPLRRQLVKRVGRWTAEEWAAAADGRFRRARRPHCLELASNVRNCRRSCWWR